MRTSAQGTPLDVLLLTFVAALFFASGSPALAQATAPSVALTLNASRFEIAQTLKVGLTVQNQIGNPPADLYVGALLPDGQTLVFLDSTGIAGTAGLAMPAQFFAMQAALPGFAFNQPSLFQFTFPATGVPRGTYQVFAALVRQGALLDNSIDPGDILAIDVKPFRFLLPTRGLFTQIERRGFPNGYHPGELIRQWNNFDSVVGHTPAEEAALQLDVMRAMGVNTITYELRTGDNVCSETNPTNCTQSFPSCLVSLGTGLLWPQPTSTELANLRALFDLVSAKGMRVILSLTSMHMEEQPPTNSQTWLGAILGVVKDHPALDLVVFNGDTKVVDSNGDGVPDSCGVQGEAPLWLGPQSVPAQYVKWAISFARSLGIPTRKLSAEAIIGNFLIESQPPAGPDATDRHLWSPIVVLKTIFDQLGIPASERTYGLSFYEAHKCATAGTLPCSDTDPHTWADQTLQLVLATIGTGNGARVVASEMGALPPTSSSWPAERALASLVSLFEKYGLDGGAYYKWVAGDNVEDTDPTRAWAVKRRNIDFIYNPVQQEVLHMGGFP